MENGANEVSGNMTSWLLNLLGKALLLFVMSLLLGIALNFMVVWTSKYFGGLYDMDQDGTTHFRATLTDYEGKYDGFPYVGLFTLVALIVVGSYFGYQLALDYEMYLENDSWPTLMEYIGDQLP
jgi:H+/Cl- antiporter ClcA